MTTTTLRTRRRLAILWTGACLAAGIGIVTMDSEPEAPVVTVAVHQVATEDLATADRLMINNAARFLPGTDLTPDQAREVVETANRVCDGLTAQVPEGFMIREVAETQGLSFPEAHAFVEAAMALNC